VDIDCRGILNLTGKSPSFLMTNDIRITHDFAENIRQEAAEIFFDAFRKKIEWMLGGRTKSAGFHSIRLEVVQSNSRARALCERIGFKTFRKNRLRQSSYLFGFSSTTEIMLNIAELGNRTILVGEIEAYAA
jgi:hypothetical protein